MSIFRNLDQNGVYHFGYVERRVEARLVESSAGLAAAVERVVEDYAAVLPEDGSSVAPRINDEILAWLAGIVGQEIHLFESGEMTATSRPELFASGLAPTRLRGDVWASLTDGGLPYVVRRERLGPTVVPVAYARVDLPGARPPSVVGVPLVLQQRDVARTVDRMAEMLLLVTVLTAALLSLAAAWVARSVARPVGLLAAATARIARGDYGARLTTRTRDEIASLVDGFNAMSDALARQRAELERRRDYMEALLSNATTGVISTDPGGRIVTVNPAAERITMHEAA